MAIQNTSMQKQEVRTASTSFLGSAKVQNYLLKFFVYAVLLAGLFIGQAQGGDFRIPADMDSFGAGVVELSARLADHAVSHGAHEHAAHRRTLSHRSGCLLFTGGLWTGAL